MTATDSAFGAADYSHAKNDRIGVLFVNLGTPDAPQKPELKRYLKEFLSDPRIVEAPRWLWFLLLRLVILPTRSGKSAEAYREVWTERGSPLAYLSEDLSQAVGERLADVNVEVALAMRYGQPSVASVLDKMAEKQVRRLLVVPMYPQYSATTTASIFDAVTSHLQTRRWIPEVRFINEYFHTDAWVKAMAAHIAEHRAQLPQAERLLMSFHGIPRRYFLNGDPYYCQCQASARLIAAELGLGEDDYAVTFQSRFGKEEWLQPYTDKTLESWGKQGMKRVQVVCPGFAVDCLETLEEIAGENREIFQEAGGGELDYIPALNAEAAHADAMAEIIRPHLNGWPAGLDAEALKTRQQRAEAQSEKAGYPLES
ncbi:MAG: ferrochelatase [Xanthomonadales bacterium]|nr:ferrochelatase [Xanthomonadales bacterium]